MNQRLSTFLLNLRNTHGLSSFTLKMVAIAGMTACHVYVVFGEHFPLALQCVLQACGGLTFPIMAFLLVEGYKHTSSVKRYFSRLLVFALISQIPYALVLSWQGNVLFTLALGLFVLVLYDTARRERIGWGVFTGTLVLLLLLSLFLDWGFIGPLMILMMHAMKDPVKRVAAPVAVASLGLGLGLLATILIFVAQAVLGGEPSALAAAAPLLPDALYALVGIPVAGALMLLYNGQRGKPLKWFFYAYYPGHIAALGLIQGFSALMAILAHYFAG